MAFYIEFSVFITLFAALKTGFLLIHLLHFIANSFIFIHPIHVPIFLHNLVLQPRSLQSSIREREQEQEHIIEFIYAPFESYKAKEQWHVVADHLGRWHIGLVLEVVDEYNEIVSCVDVLVRSSAFFTFPIQTAKKYVIDSTENDDDDAIILASDLAHNIHVQGLYDLPDLPLVVKTYWIRIIQRRWKSVYSEKMRQLKLRGGLKAQRQFELCGNYGIGSVCGLRGLLSCSFVESKQI